MKRISYTFIAFSCIALLIVVLGLARATRADRPVRASGNETLSSALATLEADEYAEELAWWSADERGGREPGTAGSIEAAELAAHAFQRLGLEPMGDVIGGNRTYFQFLDRGGKRTVLPGHRLAVGETDFQYGKDWSLLGGCDEVDLKGVEIVFAGYGITAPEYDYDDYHDLCVEGKAVLILRYEPREDDESSRWRGTKLTRHAPFLAKLDNAKKRGAVAVLFVNGPLHHNPETDPLSNLSTRVGNDGKVPMIHVRKSVVDALLAPMERTLVDLQQGLDKEPHPASQLLPSVRLDLMAQVGETSRPRNVVGLLRGTEPGLQEDVVVVGAHYDHLGRGFYGSTTPRRRGEIHNGAGDNASGTVGVLEIAEAFVEGGLKAKRSILFQLYDGEEKGFLGSRYYVAHPAVPLDSTVAMINLDMIGHVRNGQCGVWGVATAEGWSPLLEIAESGSSLDFDHRETSPGGSDHLSFMRKKVPVLFFCSGMFPEYHSPDDDADRCNASGAVEILKVVTKTVSLLANCEAPLIFTKPSRPSRVARAFIGIQPSPVEDATDGVRIDAVVSEGGAEKAGLEVGDVLLSIDGKSVEVLRDLLKTLSRHRPGDVVKVRFLRAGQEKEANVTLGGEI